MLEAHIFRQQRLGAAVRAEMLELHRRYYRNVAEDRFYADLAHKDWVLLLLDRDQRVGGFSTARVLRLDADARPRRFLFSGDTVVERAHWASTALPACFCHLMRRLLEDGGGGDLFWFLITKGFRTYRYLPVYFREFFPRHDQPTPADMQAALNAAARWLFDGRYDPAAGVIAAHGGHDSLTAEMAAVPGGRRRDPHVAFFLARNPGYADGDELACLTRIAPSNFGPAIHRLLARSRVTWHEE